ncbi:MAG: type II secretion system secretin GspD [Acidobacteria bacterium]|nr:type II secretion system secretin GspD [Acidobacteriota bacterium]
MMKSRWWTLLLMACVISIPACKKKQSLVDKAFEGKDFEHRIGEQVDHVEVPDDVEEEKPEPEIVLVDNINDPKGDSEFLTTKKEDKKAYPTDRPVKNNPPSPILNFEDAKLYDIIHALCEVMKINYIIDPSVKDQTITISMVEGDQKMTTFDVFDLVLKLHNLTYIVNDSFIRIVPIDSPDIMPGIHILHGTLPNPNLMREELAIQIVPLRYTTPQDITAVIREFLSPSARIMEEPINNLLIIMDKYNFISKAMEVIPIFDVNVLANRKMVLYSLQYVDAVDTSNELLEILAAYGFEGDDRVKFFPIVSLNAIMVASSVPEVFDELGFWIEKLDKEAQFEEPQVFIYYVQNTTADSLSSTLSQIYGFRGAGVGGLGSAGASQRRSTSPNQNPQDQNNRTQDINNRPNNQGGQENPALQNLPGAEAARNMIVDVDNNALIFNTTPREYYKILKTVKRLDVLPRQVFMEVTVLNISLKDGYNLGFNWSIASGDQEAEGRNRSFGYSADGSTFSYSYTTLTKNVVAAVNAAKNKGYANVLQQPHIMALDNKQASISIGDDIPIITSNINIPGGGNTNNNVITSNNVQYRKTGVDLQFTPHINANGVIRLEINLGISSVGAEVSAANSQPSISTNNLATEIIVRDNQTIVMGGMISDSEQWGKNTVPFLGRIPLLKHLFTNRDASSSKAELIVLITPRLVDSEEKSIEISTEFKEKILKEFENFKDERD